MSNDLTVLQHGEVGALHEAAQQARDYVRQSKAANTLKAYRADWDDFRYWCEAHGRELLPAAPETVALYLAALAELAKPATLQRRLAAISQAHQAAGFPSPTHDLAVRSVLAGIRRAKGTAQDVKDPATTEILRQMVASLPDTLLGTRDRALLLMGFAGAFRRSELVALDVADVAAVREGLVVTVRRSKTDQEAAGRKVGIPYGSSLETCPVRSLEVWRGTAGIAVGPLFRGVNRHGQVAAKRLSDKAVALVVKRAAEAAGLDPAAFAGHSLRAGLATSAAAAGVSERKIMDQTGHRSEAMVRRYIRDGSLFRDNAASKVGL